MKPSLNPEAPDHETAIGSFSESAPPGGGAAAGALAAGLWDTCGEFFLMRVLQMCYVLSVGFWKCERSNDLVDKAGSVDKTGSGLIRVTEQL